MARRAPVVVVTGASAGVGRAVVRRFAQGGYNVGLLARGRNRLEAARREVETLRRRAVACTVDVADADAVEDAAGEIERELGPIDVWVNNAMTSVFSPFAQMTADEFHRVTEVTYLGYVHGTMSALRRMKPRDRGVIVQVGSALAHRAIPLQSAYCGAKHAIEGFTESLRSELMHDDSNVRLTMVHLPAVNTPQFSWVKSRLPRASQPVPPIYQPEVPAEAIFYAAHHYPREMSVGAMTTAVLIGNKLAPGLGDRYLAKTGYESQMTDEPVDPNRPHNLWEPVEGDFAAHGEFDDRAKSTSLHLWMNTHRKWLAAAGMIGLVAGAAMSGSYSRHSSLRSVRERGRGEGLPTHVEP